MKTTINKSAKKVLSLTLAFVLLIGTLFTANIGINLNVDAATGKTVYWDGTTAGSFSDDGAGTAADPIIINTAAELALAVTQSEGKYYKIADGISAIVLQDQTNAAAVMGISSAEQAKSVLSGLANVKTWAVGKTFGGHFDGNGATVYGMYCTGGATGALFSKVTHTTTISNLAVKNSYVSTTQVAAPLIGEIPGQTNPGTVIIDSVIAANCYIESSYVNQGDSGKTIGSFIGRSTWTSGGTTSAGVSVNNCLIYGNKVYYLTYADQVRTEATGWIGYLGYNKTNEGGAQYNNFANSIFLGCTPGTNVSTSTGAINNVNFSNVYTDAEMSAFLPLAGGSTDYAGKVSTIDAAYAKGVNASFYLGGLNWATSADDADANWYTWADDYATPFKTSDWTYNEPTLSVWDGTTATAFASGEGTKENPYIIRNAAQLRKMIADGGKKSDGTPAYYKVADGVNVLYLSNNIGKSASDLKTIVTNMAIDDPDNWSTGIGTSDVPFVGNFDGNGVTISGMLCRGGNNATYVGLIPYLGAGAVVKNFTLDGCAMNAALISGYESGKNPEQYAGLLSSRLPGNGRNSAAPILIESVAVRNSALVRGYQSAGLVGTSNLEYDINFVNCLYDGTNCQPKETQGGHLAGIFAMWEPSNFQMSGCVSIGRTLTATTSVTINDYTKTDTTDRNAFIYNSYSDVDIVGCATDTVISDFSKEENMPLLDWQNGWEMVDGKPTPKMSTRDTDVLAEETSASYRAAIDYNKLLGNQNVGKGANKVGAYTDGTYGNFHLLEGKGTEADPYIIKTAFELASVIGAGGKNLNQKCYFKLGNDIDLESYPWLNAVGYSRVGSTEKMFTYVPFEGTLDGDGHTITGLYAVSINGGEANPTGNAKCAGLIPVLNGGTVKNLHIRDSYIGAANGPDFYAGAIVGNGNGTIEGCSVADAKGYNPNNQYNKLVGTDSLTPYNSFDAIVGTYFDASGGEMPPAAVLASNFDSYKNDWYLGGAAGSTPQLISKADAMPCADVDGDGYGYEYGSNDLTALRSKLLYKADYQNIYGDVNRDGKININDLVALKRAMANDYNKPGDGFWRNVELGNVAIYYGENDNYDAARKLELYFENLYGVDIQKYVSGTNTYKHTNDNIGTPDGKLDVIVGDVGDSYKHGLAANQYQIEYNSDNKVLWLKGANFTAVEQAVLDFIKTADTFAEPATTTAATLSAEKQPVTVSGQTFYYAWGDEFEETSVNYATWSSKEAHSYRTAGDQSSYLNQQYATAGALDKLITVSDGKLSLKRGFRKDIVGNVADADTYGYVGLTDAEAGVNNGYIEYDSNVKYLQTGMLTTVDSMLFKQGYVEIKASIPADGHAFPALWLYGAGSDDTYLNRGWSNSLFSKIYQINSSWNGVDNIDWSNTATQKYIMPTNFYELDIIELMQMPTVIGITTEGSHIDNGGLITNQSSWTKAVDYYVAETTIHKWNRSDNSYDTLTNVDHDFGSPVTTKYATEGWVTKNWDYYDGTYTSDYADELANIQAERKYGFLWQTNGSNTTLKTFIYNADGSLLTTLDASISNNLVDEYMQVIVDNEFYSSSYIKNNSTGVSTNGTLAFTDMLSKYEGKAAKTSLDIEYIRVYQLDGKRDLVTVETENFNNGNHFGY